LALHLTVPKVVLVPTHAGFGFALSNGQFGGALTPPHTVELTAPGLTEVYNIAPKPIPDAPPIPGAEAWNAIEFVHIPGFATVGLSAGDSVEFYLFGCVGLPGASCPTPPELSLPQVPLPAAAWLLVPALAVLQRRTRKSQRYGR